MNSVFFILLYNIFTSFFSGLRHKQDEKALHQSEKKELEQKLNSEMETRLEEQRETANKRENLLQEELKTLQVTLWLVLYEKE